MKIFYVKPVNVNSYAQSWLSNRPDNKRFAIAFAAGLVLEAVAFALLLPVMTHQKPPPSDTQNIIKLSISAPAPPTPSAPPPPKPVVQPPKPVTPPPLPVAPPLPPPPMPVAPRHTVVHHRTKPQITPQPTEPAPAVTAPVAPPAPPPAAPSAGELDLFQAKMRRAVQEAAITPAAAEMAHETGIVRVQFTYLNGLASNIRVVGSSGFAMLDDAAQQAVRNANYPPQPPDMAGHPNDVLVDVIFRAAAADVDGD